MTAPAIRWTNFAAPRAGVGYWWASFRNMLDWEVASLRLDLPIVAAIQVISSAGFVLMMSLLVPGDLPASAAAYLAGGIAVVNLYMLGLIFGPQWIAEQRVEETYDSMRSLPVPRSAATVAWWMVSLLVGVPAVLVTILVAALRYHVDFSVSLTIVPAVLLVSFTATMIGEALGHGIANPMLVRVSTQALNIFVVGFCAVVFPVDRLPDWLQAVNQVLPFMHMSTIMRAALTTEPVSDLAFAYSVVIFWAALCALVAARAQSRRG